MRGLAVVPRACLPPWYKMPHLCILSLTSSSTSPHRINRAFLNLKAAATAGAFRKSVVAASQPLLRGQTLHSLHIPSNFFINAVPSHQRLSSNFEAASTAGAFHKTVAAASQFRLRTRLFQRRSTVSFPHTSLEVFH